jgi:DNA helicase-4
MFKIEKNNKNVEILILARYNLFLTPGLKSLKDKYENLTLRFSTIHSSKGNEADYVIILNINKGKFGFPSKIEDDPILKMVIPEGDSFENLLSSLIFLVRIGSFI